MTTIREFVEKYLWKRVDESWNDRWNYHCFPNAKTKWCHQCWALIKFFCKNVFGTNIWAFWGWVFNWFKKKSTFSEKNYEYLDKTKDGKILIPKRWDIIFFDKSKENFYYWHIWIVLFANEEKIYVLEQNAWNWDWFWTWKNKIKISEKSYNWVLGYHRYKDISSKIKEDLFDKIVFEKSIYIWEWNDWLKRADVVELVFFYLSKFNKNFNWKNFKNLWITSNLNYNTTRQELAYIILAFLNKILGKNLKIEDLKNAWIWNWQRPNDRLKWIEFTFMLNKTMEVYGL